MLSVTKVADLEKLDTEHKRMQEQLIITQWLVSIDELASGVAHGGIKLADNCYQI
jgi:hypothetical protein